MACKKILGVLLSVSLIFVLCACTSVQNEKKKIAVIVKATDSDFWHGVEDGVYAAATELNVSVSFSGPDNEEDYSRQNEMIRAAVEDGVNAIVLSAIDFEKNAQAVDDAVRAGVKVVMIDSGVHSTLAELFIGTDNFAAGEKAALAVSEMFSQGEPIRIGIVNCYEATANVKQREEGFRSFIETIPDAEIVDSVHVNSNTRSAAVGSKALLQRHPEINVLVGLNEWMTLGVGTAIEQDGLSGCVHGVGFDTNALSVDMIESGDMDALIVQNPFAIGFLGVRYAVDLLQGDTYENRDIFTDVTVVTRENLFNEDIQKILFRFQ